MSLFARNVFLLWLLMLSSTCNAFGRNEVHVKITNSLEDGADLYLHCKSADNDLGVKILHPNASYGWSFSINFFATTLFHCSFQWEYDSHSFAIYKATGDGQRCDTCSWKIKRDGPCLILPQNSECYPWDSLLQRINKRKRAMSLYARNIFLLWLLMLSSTCNAFGRNEVHVTITNSLEDGADLYLHCKSADNDLGVKILHPNTSYGWSFSINFFATTLFHCSFQWEYYSHSFAIYKATRDGQRCDTCSWKIKRDGPCLILPQHSECYRW
ncbi:S-protein-like 2, partial [Mucuna pruriens]